MTPMVLAELAGSAGYGGGERYLEVLFDRLDRARFRPLLICPEAGPFADKMAARGVPTRILSLDPLFSPAALVRLARFLKREEVAILQTHGARANFYGRLAGWLAGVPCVVSTVHNSINDYEVGRLKRWLYKALLRVTVPLADRIICVSEAIKRDLLDDCPAAVSRAVTVYNGVDVSSFDGRGDGRRIRQDWCLGRGPVLVTVARLTEQKGQRFLIEALPGLLSDRPTLSCVFVGEGDSRESLRRLARGRGVEHACRFAGARDDVIDWYAAADVVVLPSLSEGFPFVVLEALAMSKPVVATKVNGVPEIIEDGRTGLLVPPRDPQALERAIRRILHDPESAARMARAGCARVAARLTAGRMVQETTAVFERALVSGCRSAAVSGKKRGRMNTALVVPEAAAGCPCGSAGPLQDAFRTDTRRYVRCPTCDLVFLYPRPAREVVESYFREAYDGDYGEAESSDDRLPVFQSVLDHLSAYRTPPGALLDIGCGDGEFLALGRKAGWDCSGLELSQRAAARAARKGLTMLPPQFLERGDANVRFDVVTLINVLETVADPLTMLRQAASVLSSDGLLLVRATNGTFHLPMRVPARWVGSQYDQAFHCYLYTPKTLRHFMSLAGLRVLGVRNSRPSLGPLSPAHPLWSRVKWTASRGMLWPFAQVLFAVTGGRAVFAPSFEIVAQRQEDGR